MSATCGCGGVSVDGHSHEHPHAHETVLLEERVLAKNDHLAAHNRAWLAARSVVAVNLMSSPGSGKTTLLERTVRSLAGSVCVIEGDQETSLDAERMKAALPRVLQTDSWVGCHLDASMVMTAVTPLAPSSG